MSKKGEMTNERFAELYDLAESASLFKLLNPGSSEKEAMECAKRAQAEFEVLQARKIQAIKNGMMKADE